MKTFVVGDIHGNAKALKEVLKLSKFNYNKDKLIVLGDVVDGGYNTYEVIEELLKIINLIYIIGNHDEWFLNHLSSGWADEIWIQQGGANTLRSYGAKVKIADLITKKSVLDLKDLRIPVTHQEFFNRGIYYYEQDNMLFVHAGINPKIPKLESQSRYDLLWDRSLIEYAKEHKVGKWDAVFIGHTTTQTQGRNYNIKNYMLPIKYNNLWMIDTGAGWRGKLTIMDIYTKEYWQSKETECDR